MKRFFIVFLAAALVATLPGCEHGNAYDGHYTQAYCIMAVIVLLCLVLAKYTNMLRDEISDCDQFDAEAAKMQRRTKSKLLNTANPFSLAKTQFAGWTVIIACSYIYLSLTKGDCAEGAINKTALVLMGIGTGILTASAIIDKREMQDNRPRHQNRPSQGFFVDILSDYSGVSIHRFQNFVWTAIAMIVYVTKVAHVKEGCVMPELSDTLLALTGISGVTFLTMRAAENKPGVENAPENGNSFTAASNPTPVVPAPVTENNNPVTGP
jgi:hypothetical protein